MSYIRFTPEHLDWLNQQFEDQSAQDILKWCSMTLPNLIQSTSFGPTGMVIVHMLSELNISTPVLYLDTLHHFPESIEHAQKTTERYQLDLRVYRCKSAASQEEFEKIHGEELWKLESERYDQLVKVEPQKRALRELNAFAWINGRRRSQGGERSSLRIMEFDVDGRLKINPLATWSFEQTWQYIRENNIPYNPLHDQGYKSIGDKMTTFPVGENEPERAGRWKGSSQTECGIHLQVPSSDSKL
jgi:phosphoadenosine phosphosulfate reductase